MATVQTNVIKGDRFNACALQKGDYGEILVRQFLEKRGYGIYQPVSMLPHPIDMIAWRRGILSFAVEVKTKPACRKYPETGIEFYQYEHYLRFCETASIPLFIAFVDEERGEIYGNYLHELDKPTEYGGMHYPKTIGHTGGKNVTRYFPLCNMEHLRDLTPAEINLLKKYTQNRIKGAA